MVFKRLNNQWGFALSVMLLVLLAYVIDPSHLSYRRDQIAAGAWWQIFSANVLHTNGWHTLLNVLALGIICQLFPWRLNFLRMWALFIALCFFQGVGLYLCYPTTQGFVGLSGILHGLFAFAVIIDIRHKDPWGYILLLAMLAKVFIEQWAGPHQFTGELINARVAIEAHLIGIVAGMCLGILMPTSARSCSVKQSSTQD
ncbi:rhombosortase [Shewanella sp. NIFS-20-20]|uniref:rhombosortase n=1 Tax=Shewanella sp. NIFS-20-20 TaxID=2853806 RepID=UPI001C4551D7|nr:rhombosortase [Shewanella sp. NIFS-20-20]MBV7317442.1 rhombosortase [Shewanella sp. NIFS-20-20]